MFTKSALASSVVESLSLLLPIPDPLALIEDIANRRESRRDLRRERSVAIARFREALLKYGACEQMDLFTGVMPNEVAEDTQVFLTEVAVTWTDHQIVELCDGIIKASLEGLKDFKVKQRRKELFTWFGPSSNKNELFSFAFCYLVAGINPEPIWNRLMADYGDEIRSYIKEDEEQVIRDHRQSDFAFA